MGMAFGGVGYFFRWLFRTGYFPKQWPLQLAMIIGITKSVFGYISEFTIEEVGLTSSSC
jgi:hypothetical protein